MKGACVRKKFNAGNEAEFNTYNLGYRTKPRSDCQPSNFGRFLCGSPT